ncbi:hypothetical protein [Chelativorans xinjiangense]|uniref:hypothetical protein n=1 Tax=Chelativorans xinjiangense TaxID=2681485 RepID=UPI00135CB295|nr:hypothetical protein [Chelativorans xinjiangense]
MIKRYLETISIAGSVLIVATGLSLAEPLNSMADVGEAIEGCWKPSSNSEGSSVTLRFSFRRDGSLIGRPEPTAINVDGDAQARQRFVNEAIAAVESCAPLDFSPTLAEGIGGQVFTMRFSARSSEQRPLPED